MALLSKKKKDEPESKAAPAKEKPKKAEPKKEAAPKKAEPKEKADSKSGAYFVSTHPDGGWQVKKAGADKALKRFKTKAEAEEYAKTVAKNQGTNVVRKKKDGKIQKKNRMGWPSGHPDFLSFQQNWVLSDSRTSFQSLMVSWASSSSMSWIANPAWTTAQSPTLASTMETLACLMTPPKSTWAMVPSMLTIFPGTARHISITPS